MDAVLARMADNRGLGGGDENEPLRDTAETIHISSLSLIKMLIHARAGVPLEVMGLMIGEYIDEYTVRVTDVFSMPQTATGQSVEAVDPQYQSQMLTMLELVGRPEKVVGWYHSHPGFGCWLSGEDVQTARSYEQLTARSVSVVADPIQSVRGKVVIDAFRCIPQQLAMLKIEPRQTTSNVGFLCRPTGQAISRGLNKHYYNMPITFRKNEHEINMLLNVYKRDWKEGLKIVPPHEHYSELRASIRSVKSLALQLEKFISGGRDEDEIGNVGKSNPAIHLAVEAETILTRNIDQTIGTMINSIVF